MIVLEIYLIIDVRFNHVGSFRYVIDRDDADGANKADFLSSYAFAVAYGRNPCDWWQTNSMLPKKHSMLDRPAGSSEALNPCCCPNEKVAEQKCLVSSARWSVSDASSSKRTK